ncbi:phospho-alpha-glucosidase PagL [Clostridium magnum DSM 2767]|uniref:Phospho-alpha-glucosidase PagL n=1 Tax=Clostridium magnum DSM 2767 TaxID=1121326 RepID=A0A162RWK0_9CLOT|nr:phospho-alpha-glucosidase PagL [Clostridium magnum DSM 2767]SHH86061.1 Family 4 glycosyl hydrolase C-terminal domain-containing protein [Clostridium magnum DSM 2767]
MMVEVTCRVGSNGIETLTVGSVPTFYKGLMENQYAYGKLTVDTCLEGSYKKALQALVLNRTVVNTDEAKDLLADLMEINKNYWNELK